MKFLILSLLAVTVLTACTNYGKKVAIEGVKGDVYYKGDSVTEADARKLGTYLKDEVHYFNDAINQSVQLMKAKTGGYDVRFAVDEDKLKANPEAAKAYQRIGAALSVQLYNNEPVNIFLADSHFKDLQSFPYDKNVVNDLIEKMKPATTNTDSTASETDSTANTPNQ